MLLFEMMPMGRRGMRDRETVGRGTVGDERYSHLQSEIDSLQRRLDEQSRMGVAPVTTPVHTRTQRRWTFLDRLRPSH
jgi:hypothetical protein